MNSCKLRLMLVVMWSCFCAPSADAQPVTNFDTAYPLTPANKLILEESLKGPGERVEIRLKGYGRGGP